MPHFASRTHLAYILCTVHSGVGGIQSVVWQTVRLSTILSVRLGECLIARLCEAYAQVGVTAAFGCGLNASTAEVESSLLNEPIM